MAGETTVGEVEASRVNAGPWALFTHMPCACGAFTGTVGGALGPAPASLVFDNTRSYHPILLVLVDRPPTASCSPCC